MEVKDPTSFFSEIRHRCHSIFEEVITYFHLSEKLKIKYMGYFNFEKISEIWKHLELNQYAQKLSYTTTISFSR